MTARWRRALAAVAAAGLAALGAPPVAHAADCAGVTVVVDFRALGGVRTGCAPGDPSSGAGALSAAGFGYTYAARQPGFVCRINGLPGDDPCVNPSPTTAYWSYWHARPGGSWVYSGAGTSTRDPAPGSVEGWSFGAGEPPGVAPPAPRPQPPAPQPPAPQPPAPQPPAPQQPAPQQPAPRQPAPQPGQPTAPVTGTTPAGRPTTSAPPGATASSSAPADAGAPSSAASTTPSTASTGGTTAAVAPTAGTSSSGGTIGLVAGLVVVGALGGLAWWTARRRAGAAG